MTEVTQIEQIVRAWELPLGRDAEAGAVSAARQLAASRSYSDDDFGLLLDQETEEWASTGVASSLLRAAFDAALRSRGAILDPLNATTYFRVYGRLRSGTADAAGLSHAVTRRLLSRSSLVAHLLTEERLSCSQVARLLAATEASLDVSYDSVAVIARALKKLPELSPTAAGAELWGADESLSLTLFPDSTLAESCKSAAIEVEVWLPDVDIEVLLRRLSGADSSDIEPTWPYLQMLHWCLLPLEFYDHPASFLYEFAPRGNIGTTLFARYPAVTGNPVLNNAKAVETVNATWARNRGGDDAHALVDLLRIIESLPYVPRRQVARVLRAWLMRVIELRMIEPRLLSPQLTVDAVGKVIDYVVANETNTAGVIEQRVVDSLATLAFDEPGWRARGLGDGVNASNLSRHKLGDVEFSNVDGRTAVALEAHGGFLSSVYVLHHQRSLARAIEQRLRESWASIDDAENWTVRVIFVAHSRAAEGLPQSEVLHGVYVEYEYMDYEDLVSLAAMRSTADDQVAAFELHVVDALNKPTVREAARQRFREILESV